MRRILTTVTVLAAATAVRAESIAREAITFGHLAATASEVAVVRADGRLVMGALEVLQCTVLERFKGGVTGSIQVLLRGQFDDVRQGDDLLAFLQPVAGESLGLVGGNYYGGLGPSRISILRLPAESRAAWLDRVRAHLAGDAVALAHRLVTDVTSADTRLATDAVVDLWHQKTLDLSVVLASAERRVLADTVLAPTALKRFEQVMPHALIVLGRARATEAYEALVALGTAVLPPGMQDMIGEALQQIAPERAVQDLSATLTGTPEAPPSVEARVRLLAVVRGLARADMLPTVEALFGNGEDLVRRWALVTAGHLGNTAAVPGLTARLESGPGDDPACAAYALHRLAEPAGLDALRRFSQTHARPDVRAWLEKFLARPAFVGEDVLVKLARGY